MIRLVAILVTLHQLLHSPALAESKKVFLTHREPAVTGTQAIGNLVVAKKRIRSGTTVSAGDVQLLQADLARIPDNAYKKISTVVGKIARYDIDQGSILGDVDFQQKSASKKILQIDLDPQIYAKLQTMAKKQKLSESAMAGKLLEKQLKNVASDAK